MNVNQPGCGSSAFLWRGQRHAVHNQTQATKGINAGSGLGVVCHADIIKSASTLMITWPQFDTYVNSERSRQVVAIIGSGRNMWVQYC